MRASSDSIGAVVSPFMPDEEKLAAVREALPATGAGIYLNTGWAGPIAAETAAAMAELAGWEVATGRAHAAFHDEELARMDEARGAIAAVIHAPLDAIALTHGTSDGINAALWSIDWQPGDNLVTTRAEFPGVAAAIGALAGRWNLDVRWVDIDGDDVSTLAAFAAAFDARTRMVVLSHVTFATGERLPVAGVVALARASSSRVLVVLDAAQSAGAIPVDVGDLGVDFLALPARKWLLGPAGLGALYVAPAALDVVRPALAGVNSMRDPRDPARGLRGDARAFESTGFYAPAIAGMARSCGWLSMYVGLDWIVNRAQGLARRAFDALAATPGVTVLTPSHRIATMVTFRIGSWRAEDALDELGRRTFAIARYVEALDAIRISTAFFNTEAEIARFCEAVAEIAAHTSATLPRRPALTILGQG